MPPPSSARSASRLCRPSSPSRSARRPARRRPTASPILPSMSVSFSSPARCRKKSPSAATASTNCRRPCRRSPPACGSASALSIWHLPLFISGEDPWLIAVAVMAVSVVYAWLFVAGGSVWPVVIVHFTHNYLGAGFFQEVFASTRPHAVCRLPDRLLRGLGGADRGAAGIFARTHATAGGGTGGPSAASSCRLIAGFKAVSRRPIFAKTRASAGGTGQIWPIYTHFGRTRDFLSSTILVNMSQSGALSRDRSARTAFSERRSSTPEN